MAGIAGRMCDLEEQVMSPTLGRALVYEIGDEAAQDGSISEEEFETLLQRQEKNEIS